MSDVLLGFEVPRGLRVEVPIGHMVVSGQSQRAGKTTTMEALLHRSGARALAFITKRGEGAFKNARQIRPFFRERSDWEFVESVLESTMRQKMRFERAWVVRAAKGTKSLAEVRANVRKMQAKAKRGMDADIYMLLGEYLDRVVPAIEAADFATSVDLRRTGTHAMDLTALPLELQMLVIQSTIDWVNARESGVIVVVPEAWEFVPESRGSPVKLAVQALVRKGAAVGNFAWLDSQDLAGVAKDAVRQARVWLLGVQREVNEVKRALAHIPAGIKKPRADEVASLQRGEFWACWDRHVIKVYVQPAWMSEDEARLVASGVVTTHDRAVEKAAATVGGVVAELGRVAKVEDEVWCAQCGHVSATCEETDAHAGPFGGKCEGLKKQEEEVGKEDLDRIEGKLDQLLRVSKVTAESVVPRDASPVGPGIDFGVDFEEQLYQRFKERLIKEEPVILKVLARKPQLVVEEAAPVTVTAEATTLRGRLALMIASGFFDTPKKAYAAFVELERVSFKTSKPNVYTECKNLASMGFLTLEGEGYLIAPGAKANIKRSSK